MPEISPELIQQLSDEFDAMCSMRHAMGAVKYGPVKFLEVNSFDEAMAEVIDLANYARYAFIKLKLLQHYDPSTRSNTPTFATDHVHDPIECGCELTTADAHVEIDHPTDKNANTSTPYNTGFFNPYRRQ